MKKQVVAIHGGENFNSYKEYIKSLKSKKVDLDRYRRAGWRGNLGKNIGRSFDVIQPRMPNPTNAKYFEWRILFQKIAPLLKNKVILIGHSLGGIFLAKYLAENKFPKKIKATFLVAAPFDEKDAGYSLADFILPKRLARFEKQGREIFIYQSKDDPVVPAIDAEKYQKALPTAN